MAATNSTRDVSIRQKAITRLWPLAIVFLGVYIPVSFFVMHDQFISLSPPPVGFASGWD